MGCGASKEAPVSTSTGPRHIPPVAAQQPKAVVNNGSNGSAPPSPKATKEGNGAVNPATIMVTNLNDVVQQSPQSQGRGRFLSYASGASTPNTSDGEDLSWDDKSEGSAIGSSKGSERGKHPKVLAKSGSAIGLDEIHQQSERAGLTAKVVHIEVPFGKPIEEVYDGVHNGPVLGSGVSGLVRLVTHKATGLRYAVKCLDLSMVGSKAGLAQLREEIFIMCQLDHPNIVRLEEVYESHSEIYLVQELCLGGELFDRLDEQPDYHYTEAECARLVKQMLSAVRYLHSKGIIHRDLKLENFLFSGKTQDSELKMIDFGLSKHFQFGEVHHEAVGTPYTVAPEVIRGSYDERCDIWAIGVITFLLLSGDPPFGGCGGPESLLTVRANILACKYEFEPEDIWGLVSDKAKDFVRSLLVLEPQQRPTARGAQKQDWLREWASRQSTKGDAVLNPNVVKALVNFKEFSHMRKLLSEVLSFTLLPEQITELRKEFEKVDTDGSGEISLDGLKEVLMTNAGAGSLGALTEEEVEGIFNAMRVNKTETRIHWHEFIAAGLSQCQVDDRNLRLAFERLDGDHKGFITLDDIMNLVGNNDVHNEEHLRTMWKDSMRSVNCATEHITYDNFLLLMKGQTKEPPELTSTPSARLTSLSEIPEMGQAVVDPAETEVSETKGTNDDAQSLGAHLSGDKTHKLEKRGSEGESSLHSLPNLEPQAMYESSSSSLGATGSPRLDSPLAQKILSEIAATEATLAPELPQAMSSAKSSEQTAAHQSPLDVNRQLFRAHRQMRVSILEASERFEEERLRRARDTLIAQKTKEAGTMLSMAGLVMRHGHKVQVTTDAIREYLAASKAEQQQIVDKATRRGGRGRSNRKKTISDMSAMMNPSLTQDEMGDIAAKARTPDTKKSLMYSSLENLDLPDLTKPAAEIPKPPEVDRPVGSPSDSRPSVAVVDKTLRQATVPGQFRQTKDPFSLDGMYGGARISKLDVNQIKSVPKSLVYED